MKRAVVCVDKPEKYIPELDNYSIMIINPNSSPARMEYLLTHADYSLLITNSGYTERNGADYPNERLLWYTSGTTGDSKFCSFTQEQLDHSSRTIIDSYNITENDRYVSIMPLWHAHGQGFYWATRTAGCSTNFITAKQLKTMPEYNPTFITAVPDVLRAINHLEFDHLRFVRSASAPLSNQLFQELSDHYNVPIVEAFGMTEALSHCFTNPLLGKQRMGTVGLPSGIEADIVDNRLYIRGPSVVNTGWFDTGDLAEKDEAGYYRIIGRHRDQINIKGIKLNPASIEQQLMSAIPDIKECVIFGSNRVKCLYVGAVDPGVIKSFLMELNRYCVPSLLAQVDAIPISPSGKISRSWLDNNY